MFSAERPQDRIFLTIDRYEAIDFLTARQDFFDLVGGVKFGIRFLRMPRAAAIRGDLARHKLKLFLDVKLEESATQMPETIDDYRRDGYNFVSISGGVECEAMLAAAQVSNGLRPIIALARHQPHLLDDQLRKINEVNDQLDSNQQIQELLTDVGDLPHVRASSPDWILTATGIYAPGTTPPEGPDRLLPREALEAGADRIAVGSAVFGAGAGRVDAMRLILADCV